VTTIVAIVRIIHNAAVTLLVASGGFVVASVVAHHIAGLESLSDGLASTYPWNFALSVVLYALLAVLLVGRGLAGLITSRRRAQP
jgi:hypothetical protein